MKFEQSVGQAPRPEAEQKEVLDVGTFRFEGVAKCYELKLLESDLFFGTEGRLVLSPQAAEAVFEEQRRRLIKNMARYGASGGALEENKLFSQYADNQRYIERAIKYLEDQGLAGDDISYEEAVALYSSRLRLLYEHAFRRLLTGEAIEELNALRAAVVALFEYNEKYYYAYDPHKTDKEKQIEGVLRCLDSLLPGRDYSNKKGFGDRPVLNEAPALGAGFFEYLRGSTQPIDVGQVSTDQTIYIESIGTVAKCERGEDGTVSLKIRMEDQDREEQTGSGMGGPELKVERVRGKVYPFTFLEGLPEAVLERAALYEDIPKALERDGVQTMETHIFDPTFLFNAIDTGAWNLPHLKGFQVETKPVKNVLQEEFKYFKKKFPYYTFIFNGDLLEQESPRASAGNTMSGFHFIPKGLRLDHPAFLYCIVPPGIRTKLLLWINSMDEGRRRGIFGEKEPEKFFISSSEDLGL